MYLILLLLASFSVQAQIVEGPTENGQSYPPPSSGQYSYNSWGPSSPGFPDIGGTYTDPVYGLELRRMTNNNGRDNWDNLYAFNRCNADGSACFMDVAGSMYVRSSADGSDLYTNIPTGLSDAEIYWHPSDPDIYYRLSGPNFIGRNLSTGSDFTVKTFPQTLQENGKSHDVMDRTARYITVRYGGTNKVYDIQEDVIYSGTVPSVGTGYVAMQPSGKFLIAPGDSPEGLRSYALDHDTNSIGPGVLFWTLCGDHAAFISPSDGKDYAIVEECNSTSGVFRADVTIDVSGMTGNQQRAAHFELIDYADWLDWMHATAARKAGVDWAFISVASNDDTFGSSTSSWRAYKSEIIGFDVVTGDVWRIAHHRSRSTSEYARQPRVTTSADASVVMWASSHNQSTPSAYSDLYLINNPFGAVTPEPPSPVINLRIRQN